MKASVIITSFNRPELLSFGLDSLAAQGFSRDDVEIIVLNDGDPNDGTDGVCELFDEDLNIRYFEAKNKTQWRTPGFAFNYGVKQSNGDFIFLSCAEIYHLGNTVDMMISALERDHKTMVIPKKGFDDNGSFLESLQNGSAGHYKKLPPLTNIHFPFFMGMSKQSFMNIGGYDEDFTGIGFDDTDIVNRLKRSGLRYQIVPTEIIHIFHNRIVMNGEMKAKLGYNQSLFNKRKSVVVRNTDRKWGESF